MQRKGGEWGGSHKSNKGRKSHVGEDVLVVVDAGDLPPRGLRWRAACHMGRLPRWPFRGEWGISSNFSFLFRMGCFGSLLGGRGTAMKSSEGGSWW